MNGRYNWIDISPINGNIFIAYQLFACLPSALLMVTDVDKISPNVIGNLLYHEIDIEFDKAFILPEYWLW